MPWPPVYALFIRDKIVAMFTEKGSLVMVKTSLATNSAVPAIFVLPHKMTEAFANQKNQNL